MTIRIFFQGEKIGPQLLRSANKNTKKVLAARRGATEDARDLILKRGRADMRSAGNFGSRWTEGFQGKITEGGGFIRLSFTHAVPYFRVFQRGAVIRGKPLLWIPLSFADDAQGIRARDYPGRLFRVNRKSGKAPLLLAVKDKQPKYFGKEYVTIPKKFHVIEIIRDVAQHMKELYKKRFKQSGK